MSPSAIFGTQLVLAYYVPLLLFLGAFVWPRLSMCWRSRRLPMRSRWSGAQTSEMGSFIMRGIPGGWNL
jgi:hypothetical protein